MSARFPLVLLLALALPLPLAACTEVDAPQEDVESDVEDIPQELGGAEVETADAIDTVWDVEVRESILNDQATRDVQVRLDGETVEIVVVTEGVDGATAQLKARQYMVEAFRALEGGAPEPGADHIGLSEYGYHVVVRDGDGATIAEARKAAAESTLTYGGA
ncbi:MAG: hypothetical protein R3362_13650 [Rhodothermales bacterium]|nr:hypothetical protein [Rhodothermales bacterium]